MPAQHARSATAAALEHLERHEVVDGELVEKASPSGEHGRLQFLLSSSLGPLFGRGGLTRPGGWWLATEVEVELARHEVYVPDLAGWRVNRVPAPPDGKPVRVVPDWVCEILSPSTAARDLGHKRDVYHRARVGHFWVVEPVDRVLTVYRWSEPGYLLVLGAGPGDVVRAEPFEAAEIDLALLFES